MKNSFSETRETADPRECARRRGPRLYRICSFRKPKSPNPRSIRALLAVANFTRQARALVFRIDWPTPLRTATGKFLKTSGNDKRVPRCRWLAFTVSPVSIFAQDWGALAGSTMCEPSQNPCERAEVSGAFERASHLGTMVMIQISRLRRAYATRLFPLLPIAFIGTN